MRRFLSTLILFLALLTAFGQQKNQYKGKASYYAGKFHGRLTASGEKYNKNALTAAHKKLPFGTRVKVTNLRNNKSVVVTINDRGPFVKGRIIDLSLKAAKEIDMVNEGVGNVKLTILTKDKPLVAKNESVTLYNLNKKETTVSGFCVQLGSYSTWQTAKKNGEVAKKKGIEPVYIEVVRERNKQLYRVLAGKFPTKQIAIKKTKLYRKKGYKGFARSH